MKRNILILEDKLAHQEALKKIISDISCEIQIYVADDVKSAYHLSMSKTIHLFLLDIILRPEKSGDIQGLAFAQEIRGVKKYRFTPIIFITSLEDPKLFSYSQLHCWKYIEKPFKSDKVKTVIEEALEFPIMEEKERFVYFRKDGIIYAKNIEEIIYVVSARRKIKIYCKNDILEIPYKTCEEIMSELNSKIFLQCNRNVIINKNYIETIDYSNQFIKLIGVETLIDIGITMKKRIKKEIEESDK